MSSELAGIKSPSKITSFCLILLVLLSQGEDTSPRKLLVKSLYLVKDEFIKLLPFS